MKLSVQAEDRRVGQGKALRLQKITGQRMKFFKSGRNKVVERTVQKNEF